MPRKEAEGRRFARYSPEVAEQICAGLVGGRSLRSICTDEGMPSYAAVYRWLAAHAEFRALYARARHRTGERGPMRKYVFYSPELAEKICEELAEGRSLRSICRDEGMPAKSAVLRWLKTDEEFRSLYVHARQMQTETLLEEALEIADDDSKDLIERGSALVPNSESVKRAKLRVDTRLRMIGELRPKKYEGKSAGDAEAPPVTRVIREIVMPAKRGEEGQ